VVAEQGWESRAKLQRTSNPSSSLGLPRIRGPLEGYLPKRRAKGVVFSYDYYYYYCSIKKLQEFFFAVTCWMTDLDLQLPVG